MIARLQISCFILLCTFAVPSSGAEEQKSPYAVEVTIDASYSVQSLENIERLLPHLPRKIITAAPNDTISGIVSRTYQVGTSNRAEAYQILERTVLADNNLPTPESLKAGQKIFVPLMPPLAFDEPNALNRSVPFTLHAKPKPSQRPDGRTLYISAGATVPPTRRAAVTQRILISLPLPDVKSLFKSLLASGVARSTIVTRALPLGLRPAESNRCTAPNPEQIPVGPVLLQPELDAINRRLARSPVGPATLLIVDTCWPDQDDFKTSMVFLEDRLNRFAQGYGGRHAIPLSPRGPRPAFVETAGQRHCVLIKRTLAELRRLDLLGAVNVIFVPVYAVQGADDILRQLTELGEYRHRGYFGQSDVPDAIRQEVKEMSKTIGDELKLDAAKSAASATGEVFTNQALIEGITALAEMMARDDDRYVFVNESWTVSEGDYSFPSYGAPASLVVAAAGNERNETTNPTDDFTDGVDFAARCVGNLDTLAVVNLDRGGNLCCSAKVTDTFTRTAFVTGFTGAFNQSGGLCGGTSFAAPRVAWVLALAEAYRPATPRPVNSGAWLLGLRSRLTTSRQHDGDWREVGLNIVDVLAMY